MPTNADEAGLRRAIGELVEVDHVFAADHGHGLGGGGVGCQHVDEVEDPQRGEHPEDDGDGEGGADERQGDLADGPAVGADQLLRQLRVGRQEGVAGGAAGAAVLHALEPAALALPVADGIADEVEPGRFLEVIDRKDVLEGGLQAGLVRMRIDSAHGHYVSATQA